MGLGIGPLELGVVLLVALLVFGPRRLPDLMNTVGRSVAEFRRTIGQVSVDLQNDALARSPRPERPANELIAQSPPRDVTPPSE